MNKPPVSRARKIAALVVALIAVALAIYGHQLRKVRERAELLTKTIINVPPGTPPECIKDHKITWTMYGFLDEGNVPPKPGCPGYDSNLDKEFGAFILGSVTYRIPRAYIAFDRYQKDGPVDGLWLMFKYPEMAPGDADAPDQSQNISVSLNRELCTSKEKCMKGGDSIYHGHLNIVSEGGHIDRTDPVFSNGLTSIHLTAYAPSGNVAREIDIYYEGPQETPANWLVCTANKKFVNQSCESVIVLNDASYATYRFRRPLFDDRGRIRDLLRDKLTSFIVTP